MQRAAARHKGGELMTPRGAKMSYFEEEKANEKCGCSTRSFVRTNEVNSEFTGLVSIGPPYSTSY